MSDEVADAIGGKIASILVFAPQLLYSCILGPGLLISYSFH